MYVTDDDKWEIVTGERGNPNWTDRQWIARSRRNPHKYSDPLPSLREAKRALAEMIEMDHR